MVEVVFALCAALGCEDGRLGVDVEVATFNIRWPSWKDGVNHWWFRRGAVAEYVRGPALVALQEVAHSQRVDLEALSGGWYTWAPPANVAVRRRADLPVIRTSTLALPGGEHPRAAALVAFELDGRPVTFASVHLSGGDAGRRQVRALLAALGRWPRPWIVAGDFNAYPMRRARCLERARSEASCAGIYDALLDAGFVDAHRAVHGPTAISTGTGFRPVEERWAPDFDARIDWVMATPGLWPAAATVDDPTTKEGRPLSDHRPVRVRYRLAP